MASQYKLIRDEVITAIKAATLTGITTVDPKRVWRRKFPWFRDDLALPCVTVCFLPEKIEDIVNNKNDFTYRYQITAMTAAAAPQLDDETDASEAVVTWRETLLDLFRAGRIPGGALPYLCKIDPGPIFDETSHRNQVDATAFVLNCKRRR